MSSSTSTERDDHEDQPRDRAGSELRPIDRIAERAGPRARRDRAVRPLQGEGRRCRSSSASPIAPTASSSASPGSPRRRPARARRRRRSALTAGARRASARTPCACLREAVARPGVRDQGRRRRRRPGPGRPDGGPEPPLHRRHPRDRRRQQPARGDDRRARSCTATRTRSTRCAIRWRRAVDMNDRALRDIAVGLGGRAERLPARDRLRHHRRVRGDGDHRRRARPPGPAPAARRDHRRVLVRRRQAGHRRGPRRRRRDDRPAQGGDQAEPGADARGPAGAHALRPVRRTSRTATTR